MALLFAGAMFILPFFLGLIVFVLCSFTVYIMLAKLGLLYSSSFKRTGDGPQPPASGTNRTNAARQGTGATESNIEWEDELNDAEIITLPETALRKSSDDTEENFQNS